MNLFQRYLAEEFAEDYQEGRINRREALRLIASVTGSMVVATTILAACAPAGADGTGTVIPDTGNQPPTGAATEPGVMDATATQPAAMTEPAVSTQPAVETEMVESPTAEGTTPTAAATEGTTPASTPLTNGTVAPDDPAVQASDVTFPGQDGANVMAYLAQPQGSGPFPVILVCHENRGLTDHIKDVTRRLAKAGYAALAVDLLSRSGGSGQVASTEVPGVLGNTEPDQFVQDFISGWNYLKGQSFAQADKVGMVGFCFGGGVTWRVATKMPELLAAVPFYGPPPPVEELPTINAAVLAVYGGNDARITGTADSIEAAMKQNNKTFEKVIYPGADHAFHNDTSERYNAEAARDAWGRTLAWFKQYVG